jgi:hypothetical protein
VSEEVLAQSNSLFIVNHRSNVPCVTFLFLLFYVLSLISSI